MSVVKPVYERSIFLLTAKAVQLKGKTFKSQQATFYFVRLRITDEGYVPEMRIWSDLERCLHLSSSLFLYSDQYMDRIEQYEVSLSQILNER